VYLFFGGFTTVCASRPVTAEHTTITRAAPYADRVLIATTVLLQVTPFGGGKVSGQRRDE
jgi:hypothetical protein